MNLNKKNTDNIKTIGDYGLFLNIITLMIDYAFKKGKKEVGQKLQEFIKTFNLSLDEKEKVEFKKVMDGFLAKKGLAFKQELSKEFSPEEVDKILQTLTK